MYIKLIISITNPLASLPYHIQCTYICKFIFGFCLYFDVQKWHEIAVKTARVIIKSADHYHFNLDPHMEHAPSTS